MNKCPFCGAEAIKEIQWKTGKTFDYACGTETLPLCYKRQLGLDEVEKALEEGK